MARPRKTDRPVEKSISMRASLVAEVDLHLFSELEGKVPFGAWSKLVEQLLTDYMTKVNSAQGGQHGSE